MPKIRALWCRLRALFSPHRRAKEFDAELQSHIQQHIDDAVRSGLDETEARRQAQLRLGGAEQIRQAYRDRATLPWLESVLRDVRYTLRGFSRNPVFAITAILTLALGIGATTAVFSVVDRILLQPPLRASSAARLSWSHRANHSPGVHAWRFLLSVARQPDALHCLNLRNRGQ